MKNRRKLDLETSLSITIALVVVFVLLGFTIFEKEPQGAYLIPQNIIFNCF